MSAAPSVLHPTTPPMSQPQPHHRYIPQLPIPNHSNPPNPTPPPPSLTPSPHSPPPHSSPSSSHSSLHPSSPLPFVHPTVADHLHLIALVHLVADPSQSYPPSSPPIHIIHTRAPPSRTNSLISASKAALLDAAAFIFPPDAAQTLLLAPLTAPPPSSVISVISATPPPPLPLPLPPRTPSHSSDSSSASLSIPPPPITPSLPDTLHAQLAFAKVLPLAASDAYNALNHDVPFLSEPQPPAQQPAPIRYSRNRNQNKNVNPDRDLDDTFVRRRANSFPHKPQIANSSRTHSTSIPPDTPLAVTKLSQVRANTSAPLSASVGRSYRAYPSSSPHVPSPRALLPFLKSIRAHVFAVTAVDGSRQYAFCRPLSPLHAMVILTDDANSALYIHALERVAYKFAALLRADDPAILHQQNHSQCQYAENAPTSFQHSRFLCARPVADHLCRMLFRSLAERLPSIDNNLTNSASASKYSAHPFFASNHFSSLSDFATSDMFMSTRNDDLPPAVSLNTVPTNSTLSSAGLTPSPPPPIGTKSNTSNDVQVSLLDTTHNNNKPKSKSKSKDHIRHSLAQSQVLSDFHLNLLEVDPYMSIDSRIGPGEKDKNDTPVRSSLHLADSVILFSNFSVRTIVILITALLEERRVCIVGPSTALVSRAVLALSNILHPFEWPHVLSPILPPHRMQVLEAPMPYLVGILDQFYQKTFELELAPDVLFAHLHTGKMTVRTETIDLSRHMPRRLRNRLERRLGRVKSAFMRTPSKLRSSFSEQSLSHFLSGPGSDDYDGDNWSAVCAVSSPNFVLAAEEDSAQKTVSNSLWRSRSNTKLSKLNGQSSMSQDILLRPETNAVLCKAMSKFYVELLGDLPAETEVKAELKSEFGSGGYDGVVSPMTTPSSALLSSGGSTKKDTRILLRWFVQTQMYMQWERDEKRDTSFGIEQNDTSRLLRKRASTVERSVVNGRNHLDEGTDVEEEGGHIGAGVGVAKTPLMLPRFKKSRPVSDFVDEIDEGGVACEGEAQAGLNRRVNRFSAIRMTRVRREEFSMEYGSGHKATGVSCSKKVGGVFNTDVNDNLFHDEDAGIMSGPESDFIRRRKGLGNLRVSAKARRRRNRSTLHVNFADNARSYDDVEEKEIFVGCEFERLRRNGEEREREEGGINENMNGTEAKNSGDEEMMSSWRPWLFLRLPGAPWGNNRETVDDLSGNGVECEESVGGVVEEERKRGEEVQEKEEFEAESFVGGGWSFVRQLQQLRRYRNYARA